MSTRRRSRDEWREVIADWRASGLSCAEFAQLHGLNRNTLAWWRSELGREASSTRLSLVPVRTTAVAAKPLEVELPAGIVVRIPIDADIDRAANLVRALT